MSELLTFPEQESFAAQVAGNIRAEMARRGVTQSQLAKVLGLPQSAVSYRHRGRTPWTLNEIEVVARHLRTTTSVLCAIRDSNPEPAD
jgi:predicted transcriptional regulator